MKTILYKRMIKWKYNTQQQQRKQQRTNEFLFFFLVQCDERRNRQNIRQRNVEGKEKRMNEMKMRQKYNNLKELFMHKLIIMMKMMMKTQKIC